MKGKSFLCHICIGTFQGVIEEEGLIERWGVIDLIEGIGKK